MKYTRVLLCEQRGITEQLSGELDEYRLTSNLEDQLKQFFFLLSPEEVLKKRVSLIIMALIFLKNICAFKPKGKIMCLLCRTWYSFF